MRLVSDDLDAEVAGTSQGDTLLVSAWRDGVLLAQDLALEGWSVGWDASRDVQGQATFVISDPDGTLSPWGMGDALAPGGSRLTFTWQSGISGMLVPFGPWRIRTAQPSETWRVYGHPPVLVGDNWSDTWSDFWPGRGPKSGTVRISGGSKVTVTADEATMASASLSRMDGEAVPAGATVYAELQRILRGYGAVDTTLAPPDATIPATYVYPESRTTAVGDLLDMVNAVARTGPDGALQVVPMAGVGPVWTIQGDAGGALVSFDRKLSDASTYNAVTSKGTAPDGTPLIGRAVLTAGPLIYGGPFGKVPLFHQAIATSQDGVSADAATLLAQQTSSGTIDLPVTCLAHPGIQPHDLVTVVAPTVAGDAALVGRVVAMSWSSTQSASGITPAKAMQLTVRVSTETLEAVAGQVRRG